ncbi:MAG: hypothetical protein C6I00_05415 [Nitratiruptor sp.]|nr:hypothetical protein [Nitratiruptor sp.]NPA83538.1 hypothetical protein [Campylobacterota bacterium]
MLSISKEFAPPFSLIVPFFVAGIFCYLVAMGALLFYSATFHHAQLDIAGWVHLFLVGYVMTIIFGAMAQLVPVVVEEGHFSVDWYYLIFPLLFLGTIGLVVGFWMAPPLLPFGGLLVLAAMVIFATEVFLTIAKSSHRSLTTKAVRLANIFLLVGVLSGFLMALGLGGFWSLDLDGMLQLHLFAVIGGYVMITIFGISIVLLPMFGLAHGFGTWPLEYGINTMVASVVLGIVAALLEWDFLTILAFMGSLGAALFYFYQVYLIYRQRARKEWEIWFQSMVAGYGFFALAIVQGWLYLLSGGERTFLYGLFWALFSFFAFLINGHLYKIVPFLVWFHRFSPLVGKKRVPMLHEMYPKKQAQMEFWLSLVGAILVWLGIVTGSDTLLRAGGSFLFVGAIFLATSLRFMLAFKEV